MRTLTTFSTVLDAYEARCAQHARETGPGKVGPVTRRVWECYWELHSDPDLSFAIDYA